MLIVSSAFFLVVNLVQHHIIMMIEKIDFFLKEQLNFLTMFSLQKGFVLMKMLCDHMLFYLKENTLCLSLTCHRYQLTYVDSVTPDQPAHPQSELGATLSANNSLLSIYITDWMTV